ncbi:hypothetical protein DPMN_113172 [Dreissena polymorpha]|uniref:Uncharacterized protein n=1 Tax=Dreissena polymorpha TaxID=45954 RepID=A0A9D4KH33_DREPO|nr:hypothetical protein DPMN_113172 [Dreissena polymorpha]
MRSSTGIYFFGHSFVNIGFLSSFFITHGIADLLPNVALASPYGAFFAYAGFPMCHIFAVCSIWFTVGVNVDRYMQVCWINKAKVGYEPSHGADATDHTALEIFFHDFNIH